MNIKNKRCKFYNMICKLVFLCMLIHCSQQKPSPIDPKHHLYTYGFLSSPNPSEKVMEEGVKKFQKANELPAIGTLDKATLDRMGAPRCGRPSNTPDFLEARNKWRRSHITYKIYNWTEPFTKTIIRDVFDNAIQSWTHDVNLKITETDSNDADIKIYFTNQDGKYNVLGYAYFPENGGIYFDQDESWTLDVSEAFTKTYFGWVAAHEMGHSLGLAHTETMQSIMFPYYSTEVIEPADIDVDKLRSVYGQSVMENSVLCTGTSVDAILDTQNPLLIKDKEYWVLSNGRVQSGPFSLDQQFHNLPDKIDAAFMLGKTSYFFSNDVFYKFNHKSKSTALKLISIGFDDIPSNIDAAFYDSTTKFIYFFKDSKYYVFDIRKPLGKRVIVNGKSISNDWVGIPKNIEAAAYIGHSQVLFIKSSKCYVVDLSTKLTVKTDNCSSVFNCKA